jgi:hypothetical protein
MSFGSWDPWENVFTKVQTIVFDLSKQEQVAVIDSTLWLPVGTVIELGPAPNRDAVVVGCRLQLPLVEGGTGHATILVDIRDAEENDFIPRDPTARLLEDR